MAKVAEQREARRLRGEGWTLRRIASELDVALSSVSVWVRNVGLPNPPASRIPLIPTPEERLGLDRVECISDVRTLRRCGKCGLRLPVERFGRHPKGRQWWCKGCYREYFRRRGALHLEQTARARRKRRLDSRKLINERYEAGCSDCGEQDPLVLEFDHVGAKTRGVGQMVREAFSVTRVEAEIRNCELVCANCHRLRTYRRCGSWRLDPDRLEQTAKLARGEKRNMAYLRDLLNRSACIDCGEATFAVLEFDHRGQKTGLVFQLARRGAALARLKKEISECEVRCANCHRRRTLIELRASRQPKL